MFLTVGGIQNWDPQETGQDVPVLSCTIQAEPGRVPGFSSESLFTHPIFSLPSRKNQVWHLSSQESPLSTPPPRCGLHPPAPSPATFGCLSSSSACVVSWDFLTTVLSLFLHLCSYMVASWEQSHPFVSSPVLAGTLACRGLSILTKLAEKRVDLSKTLLELTLTLTEFLI